MPSNSPKVHLEDPRAEADRLIARERRQNHKRTWIYSFFTAFFLLGPIVFVVIYFLLCTMS